MIEIPTPETLVQILWFGLGIVFARGFGKRLDEDIQASDWFCKQDAFIQAIAKRALDVAHHWWMGLILVVYATQPFLLFGNLVNVNAELVWFGWGVFIDDLPDLPLRIQGYFGIPPDEQKLNVYSALKGDADG
jgi:hypothetical protein